jgi:hypothetical protein
MHGRPKVGVLPAAVPRIAVTRARDHALMAVEGVLGPAEENRVPLRRHVDLVTFLFAASTWELTRSIWELAGPIL